MIADGGRGSGDAPSRPGDRAVGGGDHLGAELDDGLALASPFHDLHALTRGDEVPVGRVGPRGANCRSARNFLAGVARQLVSTRYQTRERFVRPAPIIGPRLCQRIEANRSRYDPDFRNLA
jgi:hypothetical protein